jgi:hypothetical protein
MRAGSTDRENLIAAAGKKNRLIAHMAHQHAAIRELILRDAARQVVRLGRIAHDEPPWNSARVLSPPHRSPMQGSEKESRGTVTVDIKRRFPLPMRCTVSSAA